MYTSTEREMVWVAHHESRSQPLLIHFTGFIQGVQQAMQRHFESTSSSWSQIRVSIRATRRRFPHAQGNSMMMLMRGSRALLRAYKCTPNGFPTSVSRPYAHKHDISLEGASP